MSPASCPSLETECMSLDSALVRGYLKGVFAHCRIPSLSSTPLPHFLCQAKINNKVDLESPKVVTMVEMKPGEKKVFCRCW